MIKQIGLNLNSHFGKVNKENANIQKTNVTVPQNLSSAIDAKPSSDLLKSYYVSFGSKKKNDPAFNPYDDMKTNSSSNFQTKVGIIESNLSYHGEKLINNATEIAKKYGHSEISQFHVLRAGLESIKTYMDELDSDIASYDDESSFSTYNVLEEILGNNVIKDKEKRAKIAPVIEEEIKLLDEKLSKLPSLPDSKSNQKPIFSKDFLNDIYSLYQQDNDEDLGGDGLVHDSTIFDAALFPNNDQIKKDIVVPFRTKLKDEIQIDKRPLSERIHLSFYDNKAENIWKNLAVGTNMAILYDKDTTPSYLINSFLTIFDKSKNGYGNLNKNNTEIVNFNDNGEIDSNYIKIKLREYGKIKDKNFIMLMSIMDNDMDSLAIGKVNVSVFENAPKNVKFVMVANKDCYYRNAAQSDVKNFFSDFGEVSMPLMNVTQAQNMFKEQPKLAENIRKTFSSQAIEKCVEAANQLQGNYPEKAQKVMELVAAYYVDKEKITAPDVVNYVKAAKEIFKPVENDSAIKVVFDTGVKLKDMVGSPSTKKEAKSIVDRIKDKSIGTKGFIIYSQDGSVGAGRKYTAQAIAGESKSPYIEINAVDFGTKDVDLFGGGNLSPEASMKKLFGMVKAQAETNASKSAILFIENFDYFSYGEFVSEYHEKAMSQLIREMNKAQEQGLNIIVMGSMINSQNIGEATSKSFKFIDQIEVESPGRNQQARTEIIDYYIKKKGIKLAGDDTQKAAIKEHINLLMEYSSYIEILTLLDKAKNVARERKHKAVEKGDFTEALLQLTYGRPSSAQEPEYRKELVTSHECGHALNAVIMEQLADKQNKPSHRSSLLNFITLDPRGDFGGAVHTTDSLNPEFSFENMFGQVVCDFGGNSCEHRFYNQDGSWGITCDMKMATNTATMAAGLMGQGSNFGKKSLEGMWVISEEDKNKLNKDIDTVLKNAQVVSDAITEVYADFNREFTKKYAQNVGTGDCIIHRKEFLEMFEDWKSRQSEEKQKEFAELDKAILLVIDATKRGVICHKQ